MTLPFSLPCFAFGWCFQFISFLTQVIEISGDQRIDTSPATQKQSRGMRLQAALPIVRVELLAYSPTSLRSLSGAVGSEQITREDIPDYLDKEFSQAYSRNQVRQRSRKENNPRKEEIRPQNARLSQIGQKFCLSNTTHLLRQLVGSLRELQWTSDNIERLEKFETTLQLLRIVASPGLGKVIASTSNWRQEDHF